MNKRNLKDWIRAIGKYNCLPRCMFSSSLLMQLAIFYRLSYFIRIIDNQPIEYVEFELKD